VDYDGCLSFGLPCLEHSDGPGRFVTGDFSLGVPFDVVGDGDAMVVFLGCFCEWDCGVEYYKMFLI